MARLAGCLHGLQVVVATFVESSEGNGGLGALGVEAGRAGVQQCLGACFGLVMEVVFGQGVREVGEVR